MIGLEFISPFVGQLTFFRAVAVAGDSAEEFGVMEDI
jgi:hypothetical protein